MRNVRIKVRDKNIQAALKKFKNKVNDSGHLQELRDRKRYVKPSAVRRKQKMDAVREQKWEDERRENE